MAAGSSTTARAAARTSPSNNRCERLTYVLDTSVLLADPAAIRRFDEHEVVLPVVVISELEGKRHHPELGYFARTALRLMDELRIRHGRLDAPLPVGDKGGSLIGLDQGHALRERGWNRLILLNTEHTGIGE